MFNSFVCYRFLLARHKAAIDVYNEAAKLASNDWVRTLGHGKTFKLMCAHRRIRSACAPVQSDKNLIVCSLDSQGPFAFFMQTTDWADARLMGVFAGCTSLAHLNSVQEELLYYPQRLR